MKNTRMRFGIIVLAAALALVACDNKASAQAGGASDSKEKAQASTSSGGVVSGGSTASGAVAKEAKETDFIYELNKKGDGVIITGLQKDAAGGALVIPGKIEGYPVVGIRVEPLKPEFFNIFNYYKNNQWLSDAEVKAKGLPAYFTSVVLPDSIMVIENKGGSSIFGGPKLNSITLPKNLKEIPIGFAKYVDTLTTIKWPENLEIIGEAAFRGTGFTELVIPEGVKIIGNGAFSEMKKLTSITLPNSIERIEAFAFLNCPELSTVKMPSKAITYKGDSQFGSCPRLTGIAVRKAIQDTGYKGKF